MKRKIVCVLLTLILIQSMVINVFAASKQDELKEAQEKVNEATSKSNEIKAEKEEVLNEISDLEDSIAEYEDELEQLEKEIKELESNIAKKTEEIKTLEEDFAKKQKMLEDRLVAIHEEGQITFLDVILSAENIWDYISMSSRVQQLAEADNAQMEAVETERKNVEKSKNELEEQKAELDSKEKAVESKQKQLKVVKASKESKAANLTAEQKELQAEIAKYKEEIERIEEEIKKAAQSSSNQYVGSFSGTLSWPLSSSSPGYSNITSYFGYREQPVAGASTNHRAIDIGIPVGTPVYSAADGVVVTKGSSSVRGIYVMVKHADNLYTFYQHLSSVIVSQGQSVSRGQQIAKSGNTGIGSGPHLHFEVRTSPYYGSEVNPLNYTHW